MLRLFPLVLLLLRTSLGGAGTAPLRSSKNSLRKLKGSTLYEDDPCVNAQEIKDVASVNFPPSYAAVTRPWLRSDVPVKVYTSYGLLHQWKWVKNLPVRGLENNITVDQVIRFLDHHNCLFLATGDVVWKSLLMARPVLIEGEISCSISNLYSKCVKKYGKEACGLFPVEGKSGHYRLEIGDLKSNRSLNSEWSYPLVLYEWGSTLGLSTTQWSFTLTTMAIYDDGADHVVDGCGSARLPPDEDCNYQITAARKDMQGDIVRFAYRVLNCTAKAAKYLVDMTGRGMVDTCGERLAAPVEKVRWKEWSEDNPSKLYRYYLLRTLGFTAVSRALQKHINTAIENSKSKEAAQTFYCQSILHGLISILERSNTVCNLVYPEKEDRRRIAKAKQIMQAEMDLTAPFISLLFERNPQKAVALIAGDMGTVANAGWVSVKQHKSVIAKFDEADGKLQKTRCKEGYKIIKKLVSNISC